MNDIKQIFIFICFLCSSIKANEMNSDKITQAYRAFDQGNIQQAVQLLEEQAKEGNSYNALYAMYYLGHLYWIGQYVAEDSAKGMAWFEKAANAGSLEALEYLAQTYQSGSGVDKDIDKAIYYYEKLVEFDVEHHRSAKANIELSSLYLKQEKGELAIRALKRIDSVKGVSYWNEALINLAKIYGEGLAGVSKNEKEAFRYYKLNYDWSLYLNNGYKSFPQYTFKLAEMYEKGIGTPKDIAQAKNFYQLTIENIINDDNNPEWSDILMQSHKALERLK